MYHDSTTLPPGSLERGTVVGVIKRLEQRQHASSYHIEFRFKTFKNLMLPLAEVVPLIVDDDHGVGAPTDLNDRNRTSRLLHRFQTVNKESVQIAMMKVSMLTFQMKKIV
jgi:hypothetical protein